MKNGFTEYYVFKNFSISARINIVIFKVSQNRNPISFALLCWNSKIVTFYEEKIFLILGNLEDDIMKILLYKDLIYKIVFKKIKISINDESSAFLSNSSDLKISFLTNLKLLSKFNVEYC